MQLRPYQAQAIDDLRNAYRSGSRAPLLCLPTGGGKTVIFSAIAQAAVAKGKRVLILVHRRELITQASDKLSKAGVKHGIIAAKFKQSESLVQVASVDTLVRRMHKSHWAPCLIIIDECHHATAGSWNKILEHYPDALRLGVTATPCRLDGRGLGRVFDTLVEGPTMADLMFLGFLSKYRVFCPKVVANLSGIRMRGGDYDAKEVTECMSAPAVTGDAVKQYIKYGRNLPAIAFAATVKHAEVIADAFNEAGIKAATITGEMSTTERDQVVARFSAGEIKIMASVMVVSEGFDCPTAGCAILLRPTASESLYLQQVGRVLRPAEGKEYAVIIDHVANVPRHGLPCQERNWSLGDRPKKKTNALIAVKQCPECFAVFHPQSFCPCCGADLRTTRLPAWGTDDDLVEIKGASNDPTGKPVIVNHGPHAPCVRGYFIDSVCADGHYMVRKGETAPFKINKSKVTLDAEVWAQERKELKKLEVQLRKEERKKQGRAQTLAELQAIAKQKGYSPGWAYKVYASRGKR